MLKRHKSQLIMSDGRRDWCVPKAASVASVPAWVARFEEHRGGLKLGELLCRSFHSRRCQDAPGYGVCPAGSQLPLQPPWGSGGGTRC